MKLCFHEEYTIWICVLLSGPEEPLVTVISQDHDSSKISTSWHPISLPPHLSEKVNPIQLALPQSSVYPPVFRSLEQGNIPIYANKGIRLES